MKLFMSHFNHFVTQHASPGGGLNVTADTWLSTVQIHKLNKQQYKQFSKYNLKAFHHNLGK